MPAKYQVYKDMSGKFRFRLRAENHKIVAVSEAYEQKAGVMNGVKSVQTNCQSKIEDRTIQAEKLTFPKYQIFVDESSKFRFNLSASNGEIIAASEGYQTKQGCMNGISAVQKSCSAEIEDLTISQSEEEKVVEVSGMEAVPIEKEEANSVTTKIDFYPPKTAAKGSAVVFKGKLLKSDSNEGVANARIDIMDADRSFMKDDLMTTTVTGSDGSFNANWIAKPMDWMDETVEVYAVFKGKNEFKPTCSKKSILTVIMG